MPIINASNNREFNSIAELKAIAIQPKENDNVNVVEGSIRRIYNYEPNSVLVGDDDNVVVLNSFGGRFIKVADGLGAGWSLQGNSGTNPATNFIGTIDGQDFAIRRNNIEVGRFSTNGAIAQQYLELKTNDGTKASALRLTNSTLITNYIATLTNGILEIASHTGANGAINIRSYSTTGSIGIICNNIFNAYFHNNGNTSIGDANTPGSERLVVNGNIRLKGGGFIGSTDANNFIVRTNNLDRITVLASGNTGVGTGVPTKPLDINGELRVRTRPVGSTTDTLITANGSGDLRELPLSTFVLSTSFVNKEIPTGLINGVNTTFTLANTPIAGSEHIYRNGVLQESGAGNDYTISGATITYLTAPLTGDKLRVTYRK